MEVLEGFQLLYYFFRLKFNRIESERTVEDKDEIVFGAGV